MPDGLPNDMRIPTRDEERQIAADASSTSGQVRGFQPVSEVGERLRTRRASTRGVVQFDVVPKREGGGTLAVSRQLVVPDGPGRNQADQVLTERGFVRRGLAVDDPRIEPLRDLAWVYTLEDGDADAARVAVDGALALLAGDGIPAAPTMVSALHMVFKSADGPSPTSVTIASFPQEGAALTAPQEPVIIAVIDTGIDEHLRGDGWLNEVGRRSNDNIDLLDVFPAFGTPLEPTLDLGAGHGMFVSGVIRQVDPLARIVVYRALDSDGLASEESVASAMIRAALDGAHVINLSLGIEPVDDVAPPALEAAVKTIMSLPSPPAIVASAGNNGTDEKVYPAAFEDVISVAALQAVEDSGASPRPWAVTDGADWSSFGGWVRCSAVGEGIISTFVKGKEDPEVGTDSYDQDSWAVWSGTSFAAPQIAAYIGWSYRQDRQSPQPSPSPQALADALFPAGGGDSPLYGTRIVLLPGTKPNP